MLSNAKPSEEALAKHLGLFAAYVRAPWTSEIFDEIRGDFAQHEVIRFFSAESPLEVHLFTLKPGEETLEMNQQIESHADSTICKQPGAAVSNHGGFHSALDLFEWPLPAAQRLRRIITKAIARLASRRTLTLTSSSNPRPHMTLTLTPI